MEFQGMNQSIALINRNSLISATITAKSMAAGDERLITRMDRANECLSYGQFV